MVHYFQSYKVINGKLDKGPVLLKLVDELINENYLLNCQGCSYEFDEPRDLPCKICFFCYFIFKLIIFMQIGLKIE